MIHERRRLIPTMIAVIIGVAFVASTLMLMDSIKAYTLRIQAAAVGDATAVVTAKEPLEAYVLDNCRQGCRSARRDLSGADP